MSMDLSIVIVNWNSAEFVRACLRSLYRHITGIRFEILVIDGGSYDGCDQMLEREFPQTRFIQSRDNIGFACCNNLASRSASGDWLLFLNPDTEIHGPAVNRLLEAARNLPDAGAIGARLLNTNCTLQTSCLQSFPTLAHQFLDSNLLRRWFPRLKLWGMEAMFLESRKPLQVEGISGACILTPRLIFKKLGGFTETYFMYFEDMDYCAKAARFGLHNYFVPNAVVVHHGGKSTEAGLDRFSSVMMAESAFRYFRSWHGAGRAEAYRLVLAVKSALRVILLTGDWLRARLLRRSRRDSGSLQKWIAIFRWCIGSSNPKCAFRPEIKQPLPSREPAHHFNVSNP